MPPKLDDVIGVMLFLDLPRQEPAFQPPDLETIQVAEGSPDDGGRGVRGRLQAVPGQDVQGLRSVLVKHRSQGIIRRSKNVGEVFMSDEQNPQGDDVLLKSAEMVGTVVGSAVNTASQVASAAASTTSSAAAAAGSAAERVVPAPARRAIKRTAKRVVTKTRRAAKVVARSAKKAATRKKPTVKARKASAKKASAARGKKKKTAGGRKKK